MKVFYTSLVLLFLSGCIQQPEPITPQTTRVQKNLTNDTLAHHVNIAISENPEINRNTSIRVIAQEHHVILLGQSPQPHLSDHAEQIVQALPSTAQVLNYITIQSPLDPSIRTQDLVLDTKIQSALRRQGLLKPGQIVTTEDQVIYFIGHHVFENYEPIEQAILDISPSATIIPISLP